MLLVPVLEMAIPGRGEPSEIQRLIAGPLEVVGLEFSLQLGLLMFFVVFCLQTGLVFVRERQLAKSLASVKLWFRRRLATAIFNADWSYFLRQKRGDLISGVFIECDNAGLAFHRLLKLLTGVSLITAYSAVAFWMSWQVTLGMLAVAVLLTVVLRRQIRAGQAVGNRKSLVNSRLQNVLGESVDSAKLVKGASLEGKTVGLILDEAKEMASIEEEVLIKSARLRILGEPLIVGVLCVAVFVSIGLLELPMALLLTLIYIFFRLFPTLMGIQQTYFQTLVYIPAFDRVEQLIADAEASEEQERTGGVQFHHLATQMEFDDIAFSYEDGSRALDGVSLTIRKGETVGITGASGAGKSTMADIALGLLQPLSGQVLLDGTPLFQYDVDSWRRRVGYVSQETIMLHDTVRANILWGADAGPDDIDLEEVARLAHAHEFIVSLARGYDTVIGDRGVRLSGGQRQRLALARALARAPELLILDEATSALDSESESLVQEAIVGLGRTMTVLVISHRLSTLTTADRIHFLESGRIVESGTSQQLLASEGRFRRLYLMQAQDPAVLQGHLAGRDSAQDLRDAASE